MKYVLVWILLGIIGIGIGSSLSHKPKLTVGSAIFLTATGGITFIITSGAYILELDIWNKCLVNCEDK